MADKIQSILDNLTTSLTAITKPHGYLCNVAEVNQKLQTITEVTQYPTINIVALDDKISADNEETETRNIDILFICHCEEGDASKILNDLTKFLYSDTSITDNYHNSINTVVPTVQKGIITLRNYNANWKNNKKTVALVYNIEYFLDPNNIDS